MKSLNRWILVKVSTTGSYVIDSYKTRNEQRKQLKIFNNSTRDWVAVPHDANDGQTIYDVVDAAVTDLQYKIKLQNTKACAVDSTKNRPTKYPTTLQAIFNIVWERAKDKRKAQSDPNGACAYRTEDNLACFIGQCIPNRYYITNMEGPVSELLIYLSPKIKGIYSSFIDELQYLQNIHDDDDPELWEEKLVKFATRNKLKIPK